MYELHYQKKNSELMHSDVFLGVDYTLDLKHWKYIDKYKGKNGKWVYVYSGKTKLGRGFKQFVDTKITGKAYKQDLADHSDGPEFLKVMSTAFNSSIPEKERNKAIDDYNNETDRINNDYFNKSLAGLSEKAINKGKNFVSKLFKKEVEDDFEWYKDEDLEKLKSWKRTV